MKGKPLTEVRYHPTTVGAWEAMLAACQQASQAIDLEEYILKPDEIGTRFLEVLLAKAKSGITVRLILDWYGCRELYRSAWHQRLTDAGADVYFYHPPQASWLVPTRFFPRNHRKVLMVDNEIAFVGGICLYDKIRSWRDTMTEVRGGTLPKDIKRVFDATAEAIDTQKPARETQLVSANDPHSPFHLYVNSPAQEARAFTEVFYNLLKSSERRIWMTTPYFVPTTQLQQTLLAAAQRGVEVKILLSKYSKRTAHILGKALIGPLIQAGVEVRYYQPDMLHLKQILIDDWAAIGSFNLDSLSVKRNEELMITSQDPDVLETLESHWHNDIQQSQAVSYQDWQQRALQQKVLETTLWPLRAYI